MVYQSDYGLGMLLYDKACGREQLPVAVMSEYAGAGLASVEALFNLVDAPELYAAEQLLTADGHELDGLYEVVAEPLVESALYADALLEALLGECRCYVASDDVAAVAHYVVENEVGDV